MNRTKIEWVKNPDGTQGYTWNPITGCLNHINGVCKGGNFPCYAYKLAHGRLKERYKGNRMVADVLTLCDELMGRKYNDPFYPRFWPKRLDDILKKTHGKIWPDNTYGVFVCDMSDLFGIGIPENWTSKVLDAIRQRPRHRFYLLTKQPQNLIKWTFPENCWVGVTCTGKEEVGFVYPLVHLKAKVKFISFEPLLASCVKNVESFSYSLESAGINWLIIGQQTPISAKTQPPKIWIDEIIEAAGNAGIPYFIKDNLKPIMGGNLVQDFPKGVDLAH